MEFFKSDLLAVLLWTFNILLISGFTIRSFWNGRKEVGAWQALMVLIMVLHLLRIVATYKPYMVS